MSEHTVERAAPTTSDAVVYPDSDGQPMAENDLQFDWIVLLENNLELLFAGREDVYVAGDLLWYYAEGDPGKRIAPDAMVVFGRPKGYRGSYRQWEEGGVAPQVVFEVDSPGNRAGEMARKQRIYEALGVEEYYRYYPQENRLLGWVLRDGRYEAIAAMDGWVSPRLGVRFEHGEQLRLYGPDGQRFLTTQEREAARRAAEQRAASADAARVAAEQRRVSADAARVAAEQRRASADADNERLRAWFRERGLEPPA